jgi:hypothetical protein
MGEHSIFRPASRDSILLYAIADNGEYRAGFALELSLDGPFSYPPVAQKYPRSGRSDKARGSIESDTTKTNRS